eukprot:831918-Prymnesium_polylepis.1
MAPPDARIDRRQFIRLEPRASPDASRCSRCAHAPWRTAASEAIAAPMARSSAARGWAASGGACSSDSEHSSCTSPCEHGAATRRR